MSKLKTAAKNNIPPTGTKKVAKGKTPREMMNKHIQDKNDVISEEDFKNLDLDLEDQIKQDPLLIKDHTQRPKDEDKDPKELTPWDVIK